MEESIVTTSKKNTQQKETIKYVVVHENGEAEELTNKEMIEALSRGHLNSNLKIYVVEKEMSLQITHALHEKTVDAK